ncbi:MAG: hypothetical protein WCF99_13695 [Chloroflexales bacterium]
MTDDCATENRPAPRSLSLNDLDLLWSRVGQDALADEDARGRYLAHGCPLPPPPPPPPAAQTWHQPLCA